jgi:hypothetical protein
MEFEEDTIDINKFIEVINKYFGINSIIEM